MIVSQVAVQSVQDTQLPSQTNAFDLETLVQAPSDVHVAAFQSAVQKAQASELSSDPEDTSGSVRAVLGSWVDNIQIGRQRLNTLASKAAHLTVQDAIDMQKTAEDVSLSTQFLSKAVTTATKAVDALVHLQ